MRASERETEDKGERGLRASGLPRGKYLQDGWRAGAYRLLLDGQVRALAGLFSARRTDHTRACDLRLRLGTAALDRAVCQPRLQAQVPVIAQCCMISVTTSTTSGAINLIDDSPFARAGQSAGASGTLVHSIISSRDLERYILDGCYYIITFNFKIWLYT